MGRRWASPWRTTDPGRPPRDVVPPVKCQGQTYGHLWPAKGYGIRPCRSGALWAMTGAPWCQQHLPVDLLPVLEQRETAWIREASALWADIAARYPIPEVDS